MPVNNFAPAAGRREWIGLTILTLATIVITFEMFVLLFALPLITADLRPNAVQQLWILDSYGFMVGGLLITMGTLGDRIGRRKLLMIGAACFAAACLVSAFATDATTLIAGRALLGIAGSTLAPSTLALIRNMFREPNQRGLAIGVWAASFPLGAILGSVVGGVVLAHFWWGSAFLLAVPVMVLLLVLCPLTIDEYRNPDGGAIDIVSALLSVGAMVAVSYGLKEITRHGAQATPILVGLCGIGCGVAFVRRQRRRDKPFMDLRLFENRSFSTMLVGLVLYALIGTSSMFYLIQYLQSVLGLTPFAAALCLLPGMVVATISGIVAPLIGRRIRPAYLISGGIVGVAVAFALFTQLDAESSPMLVIIGFAIMGLGEGPLLAVGTNLVISSAAPEQAGSAASLTQVANEAGAALGVAVMGSIGAAVYRDRIVGAVPAGLEVPDAARDNLAAALAADLPADLSALLAAAARESFTAGMNVVAAICVVILLVAAVIIAAVLRRVPTGDRGSEPAVPGTVGQSTPSSSGTT
ncbi:MFS transporter [Nocardia altamirensis]|uniref:MFS transporter n=1 Tax=Nocardia altamirensis TaxID=472158 RepID=UPI00084011D7|nr:MFS transporter [Nocardia altamirensis]